jgi:NAD(P)-dependent dehydrogenase (short-subunit alcohol dehydrogenase family)
VQNKVCFITGGNAGIGFAAAEIFARLGLTVAIGCRNAARGEQARDRIITSIHNPDVHLVQVDLSLQASIRRAAAELADRFERIDILIHNSADFDISRKAPVYTAEDIESVWATNHIGPVVLTNHLMALIEKSQQGRIITVASQGLMVHPNIKINHADPEFRSGSYSVEKAYYHSKLAQVMYTYGLAEELKDSRITVNCIRVPNVKIDIRRYPNLPPLMKWMYSVKSRFAISPEKMAETYVFVATSPDLAGVSGKYFDEKNQQVRSSAYSYRVDEIEKLKETTRRFIRAG